MRHKTLFFLLLITLPLTARTNPMIRLLERIEKGLSEKITCELVGSTHADFFEIKAINGIIHIKGNSYASLGVGVNWYLKYCTNTHLTWNRMKANLPKTLPTQGLPIRKSTKETTRYYLNYCTYGYSMPFWNWERWQEELDWMILHGINAPLIMVGLEQVWYNVLLKLGYTSTQIDRFISGPAFLPWWAMNNLEGWGGPLPASWYKEQNILKDKVLNRMREFKMEPVLPGYAGMVPSDIGQVLQYRISNPGVWCGFQRPAFLETSTHQLQVVSDLYYSELTKYYGLSKYYSIDPFHEGGNMEGIDVSKAGLEIIAAMKRANPNGIWLAQAWQANPRKEMMKMLNHGDFMVLDLWCESRPQWGEENSLWYREDGFGKHDWLFGIVNNFGNNVGLFGKLERTISSFNAARKHKQGKYMKGIGMAMEGIENNPVVFELFYELPWHKEVMDLNSWISQYSCFRYGAHHPSAIKGWKLLAQSVYNCPTIQEGTSESIFCARPDTNIQKTSCCSFVDLYYDPSDLKEAAKLLLNAADDLYLNKNFQYDIVDVVRQCLTNEGLRVYKEMMEYYKNHDIIAFNKTKKLFLQLMLDQDLLLSSCQEFMVGPWIDKARRKGTTTEEKDLYEWNARTIITTWGDRKSANEAGLKEYSHREWSGMLRSYYYPKWDRYLTMLSFNLAGWNYENIDFYQWEENWRLNKTEFPITPEVEAVTVANILFNKYLN